MHDAALYGTKTEVGRSSLHHSPAALLHRASHANLPTVEQTADAARLTMA